jgi:hypothetical protein
MSVPAETQGLGKGTTGKIDRRAKLADRWHEHPQGTREKQVDAQAVMQGECQFHE